MLSGREKARTDSQRPPEAAEQRNLKRAGISSFRGHSRWGGPSEFRAGDENSQKNTDPRTGFPKKNPFAVPFFPGPVFPHFHIVFMLNCPPGYPC